jgi:abortive infection bacteriophage resistance protein
VAYEKPHLPYDKQLDLLVSRGMSYTDRSQAAQSLRAIGYYRLSAYTYVFRKEGPALSDGTRGPRLDEFVEGATLEAAVALHDFDRAIGRCLLDGLHTIEMGLRVKIGYQLGKRDTHGHTNRSALDARACSVIRARNGETSDAFELWLKTYRVCIRQAENETYVQHFKSKYDGELPVWVATELMSFGNLLTLFELLDKKDAKHISDELQIASPRLLLGYLKALNVLRNHCAHIGRVWNRSTVYPPARPPVGQTPSTLQHLDQCDPDRLYLLASLCAHFVARINPATNWPRQFATVVKKFPETHGMTATNMMGFPIGWSDLPLWQYDPKSPR